MKKLSKMENLELLEVNCLEIPMTNEYGTVYGSDYLFFPMVEKTKEELRAIIALNGGSHLGNLWRLNRFHKLKESELDTSSNDVWRQVNTFHVESIEKAVYCYFHSEE